MRIAIDYTPALRQGAGVGRFVRSLVGALLEVDRESHYTLLYPHDGNRHSVGVLPCQHNVTGRELIFSERLLNLAWYKLGLPLPMDVLSGGADLYHFLDFSLPPVRRGATVLTIHDLSFLMVPECADSGLRTHLERVVPTSVRNADFVTADSENTRNELTTLLDVPPDHVAVVYGGVESRFQPIADESYLAAMRAKYGLNSPFMLYVGTIEPRKNIGRLLRAYTIYRSRHKGQHHLVIAGGLGWLYQDILREIDDLAAERQVVFLGRVPDDDLPGLYSLSDFFVYPSLYEGFGLPALEAMACGRAVLTSDTSSLPEVVGDAGVMVSPYDVEGLAAAMASLAEDPDRRAVLATRGIERAGHFSWQSSARRLLDVYRSLVSGG